MLSVDKSLSEKDAIGIGRKGTINKPQLLHAPFWTVDTLFYLTPKANNNLNFLFYLFQNINWNKYDESTGLPSLSKKTINNIKENTPSKSEQKKIGRFLLKLDNIVTLLQRKLDNLKNVNKGIYQAIFNPQRYIKEGWKKVKFKDIFDYERPDKYMVSSDQYVNKGTPVLTANKSFILGYTRENNIYDKGNVILFDDFTLETKFVNFKFMVKSSALKILTTKPNYDLYFSYKLLFFTHLLKEGHSRHYISTVQNTNVYVPSYKTQKYYSNLFDKMDFQEKIIDKKISELIKIKNFLLQNMFI